MVVHVPFAQYQATAKGQVFKVVACEQCSGEYVYLLRRKADGFATGFHPLDLTGARELAGREAEAELRRVLARDQEPVPCPSCGWLQRDMVAQLRKDHLCGMFLIGVLLLYGAVLIGAMGLFARWSGKQEYVKASGSFLEVAAWAAGVGGTLVVVRKVLATRFDPNDGDRDGRKDLGRRRAVTKVEFDRLAAGGNTNGGATPEQGK